MTNYHILNGDGLAGKFNLEGEIIICREILIEGKAETENLSDFWKNRAEFITQTFSDDSYFEKVKGEFDKLDQFQSDDEINLWFGNEAFCQVNLWFILSLTFDKNLNIFRVFSDSAGWNCGYQDLDKCFKSRQKLSNADLQLGKQLWKAFSLNDFENLQKLGRTKSDGFKGLDEVCQALLEIGSQPKEILSQIMASGETDFGNIFTQFQAKAGVYGFGDLQVKHLLALK